MGMLSNFRQADTASIAVAATVVAVGASVGVIALSYRTNSLDKKVAELQRVAEMNATVTLNLVSAVGQLAGVKANNQ